MRKIFVIMRVDIQTQEVQFHRWFHDWQGADAWLKLFQPQTEEEKRWQFIMFEAVSPTL